MQTVGEEVDVRSFSLPRFVGGFGLQTHNATRHRPCRPSSGLCISHQWMHYLHNLIFTKEQLILENC